MPLCSSSSTARLRLLQTTSLRYVSFTSRTVLIDAFYI